MRKILSFLLSIVCLTANAQSSALYFDGANDHVNLGTSAANNIRSIEFWFTPTTTITSLTEAQGLVYRWDGGAGTNNQNNVGVFIGAANIGDNGKIVFQRNIGTTNYKVTSNASSWTAGQWYHVAGIIDPVNGMELYIDGIKQQSTQASTAASSVNSDVLSLGRWGSGNLRYFNGKLDEVRIWNRALSSTEIDANKCDTLNPSTQTGLQGYWRLDDGTGMVAVDMAPNSFNGQVSGAVWQSRTLCSEGGAALSFDGTNDYVQLGSNVGDNIRSIEFRFSPTTTISSLSDPQGLVYRWDGGAGTNNEDNVGVYIGASTIGDNGKIVFQRILNSTVYKVVSNSNTWTAGEIYHVAATIDPVNGMELYIDGVKQSDTNGSTAPSISNTNTMSIGKWGSGNMRYFDGTMDEVRIWDRALSAGEIDSNKCDTISPMAQTGLKAYWRLDDGGGTTALDLSGQATTYNGTVSGAAWVQGLVCNTMTGIETIEVINSLRIYPNPTTHQLTIEVDAPIENILIFDVTGKTVKTIQDNSTTINVSDLNNGVYFLRVETEQGLLSSKFIKS